MTKRVEPPIGGTAAEVDDLRTKGYNAWDYYHTNAQLREVIDLIASGHFSQGDTNLFKPLLDSLLHQDPYMLLADYQSYVDCQEQVSQTYWEQENWIRMSILNVARMGKFSSDRAIREYCQDIWNVEPIQVELKDYVQPKAGLKAESQPVTPQGLLVGEETL